MSRSLVALCAATMLISIARAQEVPSTEELLQIIKRLESRVDELESERFENPVTELETRVNALTEALVQEDGLNGSWKGTTRFESDDKAFRLQFGGRIQFDTVFGFENKDYRETVNFVDSALGSLEDGVEFRRVRLKAEGQIHDNVIFKLEVDFADAGVTTFADVWIGFKGVPVLGRVLVGHFKVPFSLSNQESSNHFALLERALPTAIEKVRESGIGFFRNALDDRVFIGGMVFRSVNSAGDSAPPDDGNYNAAMRVTGLPIYEEDDGHMLLHVGASVVYRNPEPGSLRIRTRQEIHIYNVRPFDTGVIGDAGDTIIANVEAAFVYESLHLQAEYYRTFIGRASNRDVEFHGGYFLVRYFLTGEHVDYKKSAGSFVGVTPLQNHDGSGGPGAWELNARISFLDLDDEDIRGGWGWNAEFGVAWWLNPNTVIKFNYIYAHIDELGGSGAVPIAGKDGGAAHILGFRVQIHF